MDELEYRRGRLVLPAGIVDWPPVRVGRWLSTVPVTERGRALRALPLDVAAAAFLLMEPSRRAGLLAGLNVANIRYLCGIARDEHIAQTLAAADDDVRSDVLAALPERRRLRIEELVATRRVEEAHGPGSGTRLSWIRRLVRTVRQRPTA